MKALKVKPEDPVRVVPEGLCHVSIVAFETWQRFLLRGRKFSG